MTGACCFSPQSRVVTGENVCSAIGGGRARRAGIAAARCLVQLPESWCSNIWGQLSPLIIMHIKNLRVFKCQRFCHQRGLRCWMMASCITLLAVLPKETKCYQERKKRALQDTKVASCPVWREILKDFCRAEVSPEDFSTAKNIKQQPYAICKAPDCTVQPFSRDPRDPGGVACLWGGTAGSLLNCWAFSATLRIYRSFFIWGLNNWIIQRGCPLLQCDGDQQLTLQCGRQRKYVISSMWQYIMSWEPRIFVGKLLFSV